MKCFPLITCRGLKSCAELKRFEWWTGMMDSRCKTVFLLCCLGFLLPALAGAENYDFNLDEFEKKALTWGGYAELKGEHLRLKPGRGFRRSRLL